MRRITETSRICWISDNKEEKNHRICDDSGMLMSRMILAFVTPFNFETSFGVDVARWEIPCKSAITQHLRQIIIRARERIFFANVLQCDVWTDVRWSRFCVDTFLSVIRSGSCFVLGISKLLHKRGAVNKASVDAGRRIVAHPIIWDVNALSLEGFAGPVGIRREMLDA